MTQHQLMVLVELLGIDHTLFPAINEVLVAGMPEDLAALKHSMELSVLSGLIEKITRAELRIRGAFICHTPGCWEVIVGHHDYHRAPGKLQLTPGETVRLVCARVHVLLPVRIVELSATQHGYHLGTVLAVPQTSMRYQVGDGVMFSEDQALLTTGARPLRRPIPL